jgi:hypothetical protein
MLGYKLEKHEALFRNNNDGSEQEIWKTLYKRDANNCL